MGDKLVAAGVPWQHISELFDLFNTYWSANLCKFDDRFFKFSSEVGIPIGSPLGSLIAEIFMDHFEKNFFNSSLGLLRHVVYWNRYVDDVLCLWNGTNKQAAVFLKTLNSVYPSINFTLEVGGTHIDFLDISIEEGSRHKFNIHRKNITSDITIHGDSFCPYHYYVHRLLSIPLEQNAY